MKWFAQAPSNIALIKYMGKKNENIPCNSSLSYTLDKYTSTVTLELASQSSFKNSENLDQFAIQRFLNHLNYIKNIFGCNENFLVKSTNNFPHSTGIASSASSFAALTICGCKAICDILNKPLPSLQEMSAISRKGSGSSCRSLFSPWALWDGEYAQPIELPTLHHELIVVDSSKKLVSSSQAHKLVSTSSLFVNRPQRAQKRLENLIHALKILDWATCYQICWEEFWDMHALFETSSPHFGYILPETMNILRKIENMWRKINDGPVVTIDAGANIHLLWRNNNLFSLDWSN